MNCHSCCTLSHIACTGPLFMTPSFLPIFQNVPRRGSPGKLPQQFHFSHAAAFLFRIGFSPSRQGQASDLEVGRIPFRDSLEPSFTPPGTRPSPISLPARRRACSGGSRSGRIVQRPAHAIPESCHRSLLCQLPFRVTPRHVRRLPARPRRLPGSARCRPAGCGRGPTSDTLSRRESGIPCVPVPANPCARQALLCRAPSRAYPTIERPTGHGDR